jgi:endonuclease/exonuclease/phosphatase family metal-dependent hydrolase
MEGGRYMLTVMTLNLNFLVDKHGTWPERRELILAAIRHHGPEVVALQAVRRLPGGADQAAELGRFLPAYGHSTFVPAIEREDGSADGSAFLSRVPPERVEALRLSLPDQPEDPTPRVVLHGLFPLENGILNLVNCHISWIPGQAERAMSEILPYATRIPGPVALVGDTNSTPETRTMRAVAEAGFTDLWPLFHPDDPGFTFEADQPNIRIDYIWANGVLRLLAKGIDRFGEPAPSPPRLSDHCGLVASFDLS